MFYLMMYSTLFIYGYLASVRKETCFHFIGYIEAKNILYAPSHGQDSTYHNLCYTRCGTLAGTRNSSMVYDVGIIKQPFLSGCVRHSGHRK